MKELLMWSNPAINTKTENEPLKILFLEDSLLDKDLTVEQLTQAGFNMAITHVKNEIEFVEALQEKSFDIILSDFNLGAFNAFGALEITQKRCPKTPFVCISGAIGEEIAVEMLKKGAVDYVMKDKPGRLPFVIQKALEGVQETKTFELAQEKLKLLSRAVEASSVSVVITDIQGDINYVNAHFTEKTGYSHQEVLGKNPRVLNSGKQSKSFYEALWNTINSGKEWKGQFQNRKKNGELFWERAVISPVLDASTGTITHFVAIKEDITELLQKEDELKQSLKEKETLLAEIHHRVKNNLAVISALLQLQSSEEIDPKVVERLSVSTSRIKTIAGIHEHLYKSESFSSVDFSDNIRSLVNEIVSFFNYENKIEVNFVAVPVLLNINQALPCSLIVNEVIVNALKHAFSNEKSGKLDVRLSEQDDQVQISVTDNGIGIRDNAMQNKNFGGMTIIQVLTEQLNGTFEYKRVKTGTEFSLSFDKNEAHGSASSLLL